MGEKGGAMKKQSLSLVFVCEDCGKPQPRNEAKSVPNWDVFDAGQRCECGGKFVLRINEVPK